jgi:ribosomal protein S2
VSLVIPANDDAIKSIEYLVDSIADAVRAGKEEAQAVPSDKKDEPQKESTSEKKAKKPRTTKKETSEK